MWTPDQVGRLFVAPPNKSATSFQQNSRPAQNPLDPQKQGKEWCIYSASNQKVLTVSSGNRAECHNVDEQDHQRFILKKYDQNYFYIINRNGRYLTVDEDDEHQVTIQNFRGGKAEQFFAIQKCFANFFNIKTAFGKCLQVGGTNIRTRSNNKNENQQWMFKAPPQKTVTKQRYCKLISLSSGKAIDCDADGKQHVQVWSYHQGKHQIWELTNPEGANNFYLISNKKGEFLTVQNQSQQNGARVWGKPYSGKRQQWFVLQNELLKNGDTYFNIMTHCGKCLEIKDNVKNDGALIHQWQLRPQQAQNQFWRAQPAK